MKKKLFAAILALGMALSLAGCGNRQMIDLTYNYKYAIINLPNGEIIEGRCGPGGNMRTATRFRLLLTV